MGRSRDLDLKHALPECSHAGFAAFRLFRLRKKNVTQASILHTFEGPGRIEALNPEQRSIMRLFEVQGLEFQV